MINIEQHFEVDYLLKKVITETNELKLTYKHYKYLSKAKNHCSNFDFISVTDADEETLFGYDLAIYYYFKKGKIEDAILINAFKNFILNIHIDNITKSELETYFNKNPKIRILSSKHRFNGKVNFEDVK